MYTLNLARFEIFILSKSVSTQLHCYMHSQPFIYRSSLLFGPSWSVGDVVIQSHLISRWQAASRCKSFFMLALPFYTRTLRNSYDASSHMLMTPLDT